MTPGIYYDAHSQRWFAVEITTENSNNRILVARSNTSDPRGGWQGTTFNSQSGSFADFPTLAVDANALYVGTNNFNGNFSSGQSIISIPLNGANGLLQNPTGVNSIATVNNNLNGPLGSTLQGVTDTTGATVGATTGLVLGTGVSNTQIGLTLVNNPGAAGATLTLPTGANGGVITVQAAVTARNFAQQLGTTKTLDNGDSRIGSSVYRVGNLIYLARAVDDGTPTHQSVARWTILQVNPTTNAVSVVREGTVSLGGTTHAFFPSIAANDRGDFVLSFSRSSSSEFPSIWAVVGSTTDHSNWSVGTPFQLQAGSAFQDILGTSNGGNNRWGDYSSTTRDPSDPGSFWVTNEYMPNVDPPGSLTANDNWATQIVEVIPTVTGELRWKNPTGGTFVNTANWQTGAAPGIADHVIFSRWSGSSYQVDLPAGTTTNNRLSVRQTGTGTVTFNIPSGAIWSLANGSSATPSFSVSEFQGQSNVTISGGGTLATNYALIAGQAGGTGNVTVSGSGTQWINANDLFVSGTATAAGGTGTLSVLNGATVTVGGQLRIWQDTGSIPVVTVGSKDAAGTLVVGQLTNAATTVPVISLANSGSVLRVNGAASSTFTGTIGGSGALEKQGTGTLTLGAANTYAGGTTIAAGTLQLGAVNAIPSSGTVTLAGGTLSTGAGAGFSTVVGSLNLTADSTIALGTGAHTLIFTGIIGMPSTVLTITAWSGSPFGSGTEGQILFSGIGTDPNGTFASFLSTTQFQDFGTGATFLDRGNGMYELAPVPEPATILGIAAAALGGGSLVRRLRRRATSGTLCLS